MFFLIYALLLSSVTNAEMRTSFVQLFEWPWADVARECEVYLGPNGFAAVQISPPQESLAWPGNPWWTRYQPVSYTIFSRSGDESEFVNMLQRCKRAGVDVYVDAVINHMAGVDSGYGVMGTPFTHYNYPGLYGFSDFHHCGRNGNNDIVNFFDLWEVQNCELVNLADLATESPKVRKTLTSYLQRLLDLGASGFRIDAAKHIPPEDLNAILSPLSTNYSFFELLKGPGEPIPVNDYLSISDVTASAYPFLVSERFTSGSLRDLPSVPSFLPSTEKSVVFLENHDYERLFDLRDQLLSYREEPELFRLAQIFMLTWPFGYPQIYSGYHFGSYNEAPPMASNNRVASVFDANGNCTGRWLCQHRLPEIPALIRFRNRLYNEFYVSSLFYFQDHLFGFTRGNSGLVLINKSSQKYRVSVNTNLPPGGYCVIHENGASAKYSSDSCLRKYNISSNSPSVFELLPTSAIVLIREGL
ncbi:MAG: alpha-amylase family protein [Bdellovibrionaceae bacterium]|nr:alpha-amylase family protein [Pseudobdellovibrionaceae bacterium]